MAQQHDASGSACRRLNTADIAQVASIHSAAFPGGTLTAFGGRCLEQFYAWHMEGKHAIAAIGLERGGALIGYCILLRRNDFGGFLRRAFLTIAGRLLQSPSLALRSGFVPRLRGGLSLVAGRGGATSQPDVIRILAIAVHPSFQGQGFGPVLLRAATAIAREQGAASLALSVHPKNERALRAYARDGWERVLVDGVFAGSMRKSLRKSAVKMPAISVL